MSGVLILGGTEQAAIDRAVERAQTAFTPWSVMKDHVIDDRDHPTHTLTLAERRKARKPLPPRNVEHIRLGTYDAAISFEEQPSGMCRHLSVSSKAIGKIPGPPVMAMVAKAFGFRGHLPGKGRRVWIEEYGPGKHAVNIVEIVEAGET